MKAILLALAFLSAFASACGRSLEEDFRTPPAAARPQTWWHWMNGNVSKPGITADLEAMAAVGLGGVQIFDAGLAIPAGPVAFGSEAWFDHIAFAIAEAGRLGLEVTLANCSGWSSTGGPWVTVEDAMKVVVQTEARVHGPAAVDLELKAPEAKGTVPGFCRDIAVVAFPTPKPGAKVDDLKARTFRERKIAIEGRVSAKPEMCVPLEKVRDLTAACRNGRLVWNAPEGDWTVVRFCYRARQCSPRSASASGTGLECDKLSAAALDRSFDAYVGKVLARVGRGSALKGVLIDSYEVGGQNWTDGFERAFRSRKGYDLIPWLPALAGHVIDSPAATERFYGDFRRVIADLFAENYAGRMAERCHAAGLQFHCEAYGNGPFDDLQYGRQADVPMCEFWSIDDVHLPYPTVKPTDFPPRQTRPWGCKMIGNPKTAAAEAHVWGRPVAAAESFTAYAPDSRWTKGPFELKAANDRIYCGGVNRIVYHRYAHQPWTAPTRYPGMTMAHYGTQFERTQTWWEHGAKEWVAYQSRCQALLQRGVFVADVLFFSGETAPNAGRAGDSARFDAVREAVPKGYDYDVCEREALLALRAENGTVVVPGGVSYRVLVVPENETFSEPVRRKLDDLRQRGIRVVCPRELAATLQAVAPVADFTSDSLSFIHRRSPDADVYFVAQPNRRPIGDVLTFRSVRKEVELWDAVTGEIRAARDVVRRGETTSLCLPFDACGSLFVVFRDTATPGRLPSPVRRAEDLMELKGPWHVTFRETGAASDVAAVTFGELRDWTTEENPDVRYFSGTATYRKVEKLKGCEVERLGKRRVVIDLGDVKNIAEVTVNGKSYPALWKPPFRFDITEALGQSPDHTIDLTVRVTNYWPNRLIGDERLFAADTEYNDEKGYPPLTAKSWPEWLLANRPSPTGRHAFSTCRLWTKDDELLPAGLLGPVKLLVKPVAVVRTKSASTAERRWPLKDDLREAGGDCPFRECDGRKTTNDDSFYDLAPGMSFSARMKFDRLPSTGSGVAVLSKGDVGTRGGFLLRLDSADEGNRLSFFVNFGGTPEPRVSTSGPIKSGVWYDVAAGWDGRDIWLTVNGETRRTARPGKPMGCAAPLTIGDFNGSICDLRFRSGQAETSSAADDELSAALRLFCSVRFERPPTGETQILGKDREYLLRYDRAGNRAGAQDAFCFYVYLNGNWEPRVVCPVAAETGRVYHVAASWDGLTARLQVDGHAAQQTRRGDAKPNVATKLSLPDARSSVRVESLRVDNRRYPLPELREVRSRELLPRVGAPFTLQAELANCGSAATNAVLVVRPEAGVRVTPSRVDLGDFAAGAVKPLVFAVEGATNLAFGADFTVLSGRERLMTVQRSIALMPAQDPDRSTWQPPVTPTKTHYLDAISGDDGADGLTPQTAWRSCARARGLVLGPGERLLLRRGSVFRDELVVTACGASANWAEIGAYGEGPRPTVRRSRNLSERCVHIVDPSYLVVRDLVVCDAGKGLDIACTRGGCRGILVERCLAHHIEGLYRRNSHGIPEWLDLAGAPGAGSTSGIGVAGSRFRDVTLRDCESYQCSSGFRANGGDVWLSRMYCHDNFCPNTSPHPYLTDTTRAWLVDSVFDASGWQASAGTMGIMLAFNDGLVIRGCHFLNQPDSKSHDEGGIDFEAAGANVLVDACTFRNNAGAAIEVLGLRTPQVRNVHIRGSRFDGDNVAKKLGPSEIYVWGGTTDRRVVCSNGLVEDNGFVLRPGVSFYTNCAAATRADWTLRGNRAFASRDELNRAMPLNDPPAVEAGDEIWTDARTVTLRGRATDDGLPRNRLTTTWEQLEGPGLVRFADAATTNAAATFPHAGDYRLLLKADDGQLWRNGRTAVHILPTGSRVAKAWTFARNLDTEGWQALGLGTTKEHLRAEDTFWDSFAEPVNLVGGDYYTFALKNTSAAELVSADGLNIKLKPGVVDTFVVKMNNHTSAARIKLIVELDASAETRTFEVTPNDTEDRVTTVPLPSAGTVRRLRLVFADDGRPVTGTCRVDYIWIGSLGPQTSAVAALRQTAARPHPWLFGVPDEIDPRLRRAILRAADGHLGQPPIERKFDESGKRLLQQADKVRDRVIALASAWRLTGERKYAEAAERELLAAAAWETWNPAHWLDTGVLLEATAIGCDWLWEVLPASTREQLAHAAIEKGLKTVRALPKNDFWRRGNSNWNTSCWYGATLASIVFHVFAPELTESLVEEAIAAFPLPVEFLAPQGCYPEGPSYWGSIVGYLYAIDALESALGSDFGLASVKGLKETAFYRSWMDGPSGFLFNYSDAGWGTPYMKRAFASPSLWFAKRFGFHAQAVKDRAEIERRLDEADRTGTVAKLGSFPLMLARWGLKAPPGACLREESPALDWYSGGSQPVVVMRSGVGRESAYVGIKGGRSAASHGHDDMGSFVFDAEGVRWALDLGANPYQPIENMRGTIDLWDNSAKEPTRWKVLRLSNRGHNVVTVGDRANDNFAFADFPTREFGEDRARAVLDLSATSARVAKRHLRTFTLARTARTLTVEDALGGVKTGEKVTWRLFTDAKATVTAEGVRLEKMGRHRLLAMEAAPTGAWRVRPADELRNPWDWELDGITAIDFALAAPADGAVNLKATLSPLK